MGNVALIIFQKNPELGQVKTRLGATIGDFKALDIYEILVNMAHREALETSFDVFVFYSSFIPESSPVDEFHYCIQHGADLGERMKNAFHEVLGLGYQKALIIGTDCPELDAKLLTEAGIQLDQHDLVVGPAEDGGYYLLGMKSPQNEIFENIVWSTNSVLATTLEKAQFLDLKVKLLTRLSDIDTEEDLKKLIIKHPKYEPIFGHYFQ
jgi:uncharacterized protein